MHFDLDVITTIPTSHTRHRKPRQLGREGKARYEASNLVCLFRLGPSLSCLTLLPWSIRVCCYSQCILSRQREVLAMVSADLSYQHHRTKSHDMIDSAQPRSARTNMITNTQTSCNTQSRPRVDVKIDRYSICVGIEEKPDESQS